MAFTGTLTECQIARFDKRTSKNGDSYYVAEIVWLGGHTFVRLLDPSQKKSFSCWSMGNCHF